MSKPNKPGELRNVEVNAISLVNKAANKERFKIFKSAKSETSETVNTEAEIKKTVKSEDVEKGAVADEISVKDRGRKLNEAFEALQKVLGVSRYFDDKEVPETDPVKISAAIEDFRNIALEIFLGNTNEIQKSGRKISNSRLTKLKDIQTLLNEILNGIDEENNTEGTELTKEELVKSVNEALAPVTERIEKLEKTENENTPSFSDEIKKAVEEAVKPLTERIVRVEKARGLSQKIPEDTNIQKNEGNFTWGNIF